MEYSLLCSVGLVGTVGTAFGCSNSLARRDHRDDALSNSRSRRRSSGNYRLKRVLVIESDEARLQSVQAALRDSVAPLAVRAVRTEHDALDLLTISARFAPERLPDVLIIGAGVAMDDERHHIMRFIDSDDRYDRLRVFRVNDASSCDAESLTHDAAKPFQPVCRPHEALVAIAV